MAKKIELHWFKFEPKRWATGTIQYCSLPAQGLYINVWCFYWMRDCVMTEQELRKKYSQNIDLINELIASEVIKISGGQVVIDFLIDQFDPAYAIKLAQSKGGKEGANKLHNERRLQKILSNGDTPQKIEMADAVTSDLKAKTEEQEKADQEKFKNLKREFMNSEKWIQDTARVLEHDVEVVRKILSKWLNEMYVQDDFHRSMKDIKSHFVRWLKKNPLGKKDGAQLKLTYTIGKNK